MTEGLRERAVAYLLGELEGAELAAFERRLAADPALREEVDRLEPAVRELRALPREGWEAEELPELELPVAALPRATEPASVAGWRARLTLPRIAAAAAASVALFVAGIVVGAQLGEDPEPQPAVASIELRPLAGSQAGATGSVELTGAESGSAKVIVDGLPPSEPGTYYELWLLRGDQTLSLGSFTVDAEGHADTAIPLPVDPGSYEAFDISVESEDGDPAHSGDSVLRGPTTPA